MPLGFVESLLWLSLNVYHESRGEPEIGQLAVAHVTLNRAIDEQKSLAEVIMAPKQFSWTFLKKSYIPLEVNPMQESLRVAFKAMVTPDFTHGSTFYHHVNVSPKWANSLMYTGRYGSHKFYRDGDASISASAY